MTLDRGARGALHLPTLVTWLSATLWLIATVPAGAVQTSASLSVTPTDWGTLAAGDEIDLKIAAHNTSADTPANAVPDVSAPVPATLTGPITVQLGCTEPTCAMPLPGKLAFVPVGATGCAAQAIGVTTCSASGATAIAIALGATGILLPAGGSVDVATVRVRVIDDTGVARLGIRAATGVGAVLACSTNAPSVCAPCSAQGCSMLVFAQGVVTGCPHSCPAKIRFLAAGKPDFFEFHALVEVSSTFAPPSHPFTVRLANPLGPIFHLTLPPGGLKKQGTTFSFTDASAKSAGGIALVKLTLRPGTTSVYRVDIQAYADMKTTALDPLMTVSFASGTDDFSTTNPWMPKSFGWQLDLP